MECNDVGWFVMFDFVVYEFVVQVGIWCFNCLFEYVFWQLVEVGVVMLYYYGGCDGWAFNGKYDVSVFVMVYCCVEYLSLLCCMVDGDCMVIDLFMVIIGQLCCMGSCLLMQMKVEVVLVVFSGEQYDVVGKVYDQICNCDMFFGV